MANYTLTARLTADAKDFISGINRAKGEIGKLGEVSKSIGSSFSDLGKKVSGIGDSLTSKITKPALIAGTAVGGITLAKGFQRLVGIDTARAKLVGLGHDAKGVEAIMDSALQSVKGTAHGMDEAATTAANAVAAGVQDGKELTQYLTTTGDAAAIAGASMSEMGSILNKVKTTNKAYNGELQQLSDRGLPIYQWLAKEANVTAEEITDMSSKGQISSEMLMNAIEKNIGGAAKKMGEESFVAGVANMWAAVGRLGASFLDAGGEGGGFFSTLKPLISEFTGKIDDMGAIAEKAGVKFGEMFVAFIEKVKEIKGQWDELDPRIQSLIGKIALFGSIGAVAIGPILKIVGPLISILGFLGTSVIPKVIMAFKMLSPILAFITSPIGLIIAGIALLVAGFIYAYKTSDKFREVVHDAFNKVMEVVMIAINTVKDFLMDVWGGIVEWWQENNAVIMAAAENVWNVIVTIIEVVMGVIMGIISFVWPFIEMLIIDTWNAIKNTIQGAVDIILNIITLFANLFTGNWSGMWESLKGILSGAVQLLWGLINLWFVGKILKVGKAFFTAFKGVFSAGWNFIKTLFSGSVNAVKGTVSTGFNFIRSIISGIMNAIRSVISSVWNGIKSVIGTVVGGIRSNITTSFNAIKTVATTIFNAVKTAMTKPITSAMNLIKSAIDRIKGFFSGLKLKFPKITMPKMPSFSLDGKFSLAPPSVPKIGIKWNAKGGIMNKPTIFGSMGNTLMGGGEAGPEAILPLNSKVLGGIGNGIARTMGVQQHSENNDSSVLANAISSFEKSISNLGFNIDGERVATITNDAHDRLNGNKINLDDRWGR